MGLGLCLLGCGSSSQSPSDEYIGRLEAVCAAHAKEIVTARAAVRRASAERAGLDRRGAALHRLARAIAREYNRLNDFTPPHVGRADFERMLHALEVEALTTNEYGVALEAPGPSDTELLTHGIGLNERIVRTVAHRRGVACPPWTSP